MRSVDDFVVHAPAVHREHYPRFDWLRGVLAAVVMLSHDHLIPWDMGGDFAVQVFFALSGWLIGGILVRSARSDLLRFYFNRSIRIWIPYYLALVFVVGTSILRDPIDGKWAEFISYKVTFVYNLFGSPQRAAMNSSMPLDGAANHFWSVNAEEQFYLLAPLLLVLVAPRLGRSLVTWLVLAAIALVTIDYAAIVFGVAAAVATLEHPGWHRTRPARMSAMAAVPLLTLALVCGADYYLAAPPLAFAIVLLLTVPGPSNRVGAFVGGMSYPLYLNHWLGVYIGNVMLEPFGLRDSVPRQVLAIIISLSIAAVLYWQVDRRLQKRRAAWFSRRRGAVVCAAAYALVGTGLVIGLSLR